MEKIKKLRKLFDKFNIDGYIVPKMIIFLENIFQNLQIILNILTNFSGSAGFAIILREIKIHICRRPLHCSG